MTKPILNLQMMGRFGNQCFQFCAAKAIAERDGLELRTPRWVGEKIFQIDPTAEPDYSGEFMRGYFQNSESAIYTLTQVREWFAFKPVIETILSPLDDRQIVGHIRRGDLEGYGYPSVALQSYYNACHKFGLPTGDMCFVMEECPTNIPPFPTELSFLPDFYIMCKAKVLLRANSSFSFWSGALNTGRVFSPVIDGLSGGEHLCEFIEGNHSKLCSLEGFTDIYLKP